MPGFELIGEEERREVDEVMQKGILHRYGHPVGSAGSKAIILEQEMAAFCGRRYAQLVSSGAAALTTALAALNVGAGHEVVIPGLGHVSCFEAIISLGAVPVIADVDETLCLSAQSLELAITQKTRVVLLIHACGGIAAADEVKAVCDRHGIFLIEDFSQSAGSTIEGKPIGFVGQFGIVSLGPDSMITAGEGGAILTDDANLYKLCNEYSDHGHDHLGPTRDEDDHRYLGSGSRITEMQAAVGLAQLRRLPAMLDVQQKNHETLRKRLQPISDLDFPALPRGGKGNGAFLNFLFPTEGLARALVLKLQEQNIPVAYWYDDKWHYLRKWGHLKNGSWMNRLYDDQKKHIMHYSNQVYPLSDALICRLLSIPISLLWDEASLARIGTALYETITTVLTTHTKQV